MDINNCKDLMIIIDFIVSSVGAFFKHSNVALSEKLFLVGGVFLGLAVICIIIDKVRK